MSIEKLITKLDKIDGIWFQTDEPIHQHTPLRVGGPAAIWAWVASEEILMKTLRAARSARIRWRINWPFGDCLVRDGGFRGLMIRLTGEFEKISHTPQGTLAKSAVPWAQIATTSKDFGEFARWPGTVGGIFDIKDEKYLKGFSLRLRYLKGTETHSLDISPRCKLPELPPQSIPLDMLIHGPRRSKGKPPPRCGTLFRSNSDKVQRTLHNFGLCGVRLRQWRLSRQAPGLIVQLGTGSCSDALLLTKGLQKRVKKLSGQNLEIRPPIIGRKSS